MPAPEASFLLIRPAHLFLAFALSSIAISAATAVAAHLVLKVWLGVQLPAGSWGF